MFFVVYIRILAEKESPAFRKDYRRGSSIKKLVDTTGATQAVRFPVSPPSTGPAASGEKLVDAVLELVLAGCDAAHTLKGSRKVTL